MTTQEIVSTLAANPQVKAATAVQKPDGSSTQLTPGELSVLCANNLTLAIGELLTFEPIRDKVGLRSKSDTLTDNTYSLDRNIYGEIMAVVIGDSQRPLRKFVDVEDYQRWHHERVGDSEDDAVEDMEAVGFHVFDREADSDMVLTIVPGIGSDTTFKFWYLKRFANIDVSVFPPDLHAIVYNATFEKIVKGELTDGFKDSIGRLAQRVTPVIGGVTAERHRPSIENRIKLRNRQYRPLF